MADAADPRPPALDLVVRGACEHNLQSVDVDLPRGALTVVTGVSGSGKSSLVFDTIGVEGRRRYLETFSSYARQHLARLARPAVERIDGLSPVVAVDQSSIVVNPRSTVGTLTELYDLLRLLWARLGTVTGTPAPARVDRQLFSFNTPRGACPACKGLGVEDRLDPELLVADAARTVRGGALRLTTPTGYLIYSQVTIDVLDQVCHAHGFSVDIPWRDLTPAQRDVILNGSDRIRIPYGKHPLASRLRWTGIRARPREEGVYKGILPVMEQILRQKRNDNILRFVRSMPCAACRGTRLAPEALAVTWRGLTIADAAALSIRQLTEWFNAATGGSGPHEAAIRDQVLERCRVLDDLGLGYLTLDRDAPSLSAGEAQRIRLARQTHLGLSGLVFVLDEPSIGLHPRDTATLLGVLQTLRDEGNTVLVVEHDEEVIRSADWIVDIGPGAGAGGGRLLYSGPAREFLAPATAGAPPQASPTRAHLAGDGRMALPANRRVGSGALSVTGLTARNLAGIDVHYLRGALNVITGVSGAGKSTLLGETGRRLGDVMKVITVDQAPIGRTPRSNPATYTGCFDAIRALFAAEPEAVRRGFGAGRFSFNVRGGRCDACEGAGVQQFGMQFLGTVSLPCETCGGRRFNDDTLAIRHRGLTIHDVLELSVDDACARFADEPAIARTLAALRDLGLGYLSLGHPATMLSGGEAQRVKLAAELAKPPAGSTVYLLDEPTTGLHAADVFRLLEAIDRIVARGHTVVVIEHHLDVIAAADRVIDLGPGSGPDGGRVVVAGTPEDVAACEGSHTGRALRTHLARDESSWRPASAGRTSVRSDAGVKPDKAGPIDAVRFTGVSTHNLQHIDVEIPHGRLTVITGVSGSGKSSLAFDTLFAEGQQRFAASVNTYARRFLQRADEAEFDHVSGLVATVAISQQAPSRNPRSSVATVTELHDEYRLLFSRVGVRSCPACGTTLDRHVCPACGFTGAPVLTASMFSPNSEAGACPACHGLGASMACDPDRLITDPARPIHAGAMDGHKPGRVYGDPHGQHMATLAAAARAAALDISAPWQALDDDARRLVLDGAGDTSFEVEWAYQRGSRRGVHRFTAPWIGLRALVRQEYERTHGDRRGDAVAPLMVPVACAACGGARLTPEALAVRVAGLGLHQWLARTITGNLALFDAVERGETDMTPRARLATLELRADIVRRLTRLRDAGVAYLSLDRTAATLSGGEAQRLRLAAALQSGLTGVCYVLDEPTVGLHARDTARLLSLLRALRDAGNTVVVVEHDLDVIQAADHVIELGPAAGPAGGRIVATGAPVEMAAQAGSITGPYLAARRVPRPPVNGRRALWPGLAIRAACAHNLRAIDVDVPAGGLIAVTGVSGSGKSSLVFDVIAPSLGDTPPEPGPVPAPVFCEALHLHTPFAAVINVGTVAVGTSPWSSPATVLGVLDTLRDAYAASADARSRGLRRTFFSTATRGGRCEACEGLGRTRISMDFLPDVWVRCEECDGRRFGPDVLACRLGGHSLADVLDMTADDAGRLAEDLGLSTRAATAVRGALGALRDCGLGYLRLGQAVRTLSGGERQRLVIAAALARPRRGPSLFLMDEPTTGLHMQDVDRLLAVFGRLVGDGHTVIAVEHHLGVVAAADWVIDLGPEGGDAGGRLVTTGTPEAVAACAESWTGRALATSACS